MNERDLLRAGVLQWLGPTSNSEHVANYVHLGAIGGHEADVERILDKLDAGVELSYEEFRTALLITEISFVSDIHGAGLEWEALTGFSDSQTIATIRELQVRAAAGLADQG